MKMKTVLIFVLFGCLVATVLTVATKCSRQSDCKENECCLETLLSKDKDAFCEKRYGAGQPCPSVASYGPDTDKYYLACPCVPLYECLGKGSTENGVTVMKDAKCIMPV